MPGTSTEISAAPFRLPLSHPLKFRLHRSDYLSSNTPGWFGRIHEASALRTSSSYNVHANAELSAFRPILSASPSSRDLMPSSEIIFRPHWSMFRYSRGLNWILVLIASKGFVIAVAKPAASTPEAKLIDADVEPAIGDVAMPVVGTFCATRLRRLLSCS